MKQKKLIFNFFVNRNWKKLTDSRKRAQILADNRKSHHPIETLLADRTIADGQSSLNNFKENLVYTLLHDKLREDYTKEIEPLRKGFSPNFANRDRNSQTFA